MHGIMQMFMRLLEKSNKTRTIAMPQDVICF